MYLEVEVGAKSTTHDNRDWAKLWWSSCKTHYLATISNCVLSDYLRHTVITEMSFLKY